MLSEDRRKQLDGIVQQMVQNKESDSNVQFVVDDFKKKYENEAPVAQQIQSPNQQVINEQKSSKLSQLATGAGKDLISQAQGNSALLNKVLSFIPDNFKKALTAQHPIAASALGIMSKIDPAISAIEKNVGQPKGSLTKLNTGYQKAGAVAERLVEVAPGIASLAKTGVKNAASLIAENKAATAKKLENLFGTIIQGRAEDIPKAKVALQGLETRNINSYSDLNHALNAKIETISTGLDKALETNPTLHKLNNLSTPVQVGEKTVTHNYVKDALNQLEDFYLKTGNVANEEKISQLRVKASTEGLNVKKINDLAKLHGQELTGFNANGELANGLSKQAAENTRSGLKDTARKLFSNPAYEAADQELANTIQTRNLVKNIEDGVTKLKQKVTQRGLGERVGRLVFQIADKVTGGGLKGFVQSFVPRGEGLKVMNALDLERNLSKNLKSVQSILDSNLPEKTIIQKLEEIQRSTQNLLQLPAPKKSSVILLPNEGVLAGQRKINQ